MACKTTDPTVITCPMRDVTTVIAHPLCDVTTVLQCPMYDVSTASLQPHNVMAVVPPIIYKMSCTDITKVLDIMVRVQSITF